MKSEVSCADILRIKNYMMDKHQGYKKAMPRHIIAGALNMPDRHFRQVCSQIDEIITSHKCGYYVLPLYDFSGVETMIAKEIVEGEERRRIVNLYLRSRRQRKAISKMAMSKKEEQLTFV